MSEALPGSNAMRSRTRLIISSLLALAFLCILLGFSAVSMFFGLLVPGSLAPTAEALYRKPLPVPGFIIRIYPPPGSTGPFSGNITFEVDHCAIWEPGDQADELGNHLRKNLIVEVNGQKAEPEPVISYLLLVQKCDEMDQNCGGCSGPSLVSVPVSLSRGLHMVTAETRSLSGIVYFYSWAFRVTSFDPHAGEWPTLTALAYGTKVSDDQATQNAIQRLDPTDRAAVLGATRTAFEATILLDRTNEAKRYGEARAARTKTAQAAGSK